MLILDSLGSNFIISTFSLFFFVHSLQIWTCAVDIWRHGRGGRNFCGRDSPTKYTVTTVALPSGSMGGCIGAHRDGNSPSGESSDVTGMVYNGRRIYFDINTQVYQCLFWYQSQQMSLSGSHSLHLLSWRAIRVFRLLRLHLGLSVAPSSGNVCTMEVHNCFSYSVPSIIAYKGRKDKCSCKCSGFYAGACSHCSLDICICDLMEGDSDLDGNATSSFF